MDYKMILLGLIQGLTEFLPVSSSGHLALAQIFLGTTMPPLSYDLILHVATMLATVLFFLFDIISLLKGWLSGFVPSNNRHGAGWPMGWAVIVGTIVTGAIGVYAKDFVETATQNSLLVGLGLVFTGVVLIVCSFLRQGYGKVRVTDGLFVGLAQGVATLPGVSRSGMTMMMGLVVGLSREEAFRFSFLLSIPAICGATLLQAFDMGGWHGFVSSLPSGWFIGAVCAFVSGFIALAILKRIVIASKWWIFGVYCLLVGGAAVAVTYLGAW